MSVKILMGIITISLFVLIFADESISESERTEETKQ
jgi:hypothetical protein